MTKLCNYVVNVISYMRRRKNIPSDIFTYISKTYFQFFNKHDILREYNVFHIYMITFYI